MSAVPGTRYGPYELVTPIGEGGMGEVWRARDTRLDRTVALKISKKEFGQRFEREARAIAALNHANVCSLYDVGPNYIVMEYVEGAPLRGPMAVERAIELGGQILDALDVAHRKGIVHRDLKPANVMVTKAGVKVLDFGLAKMGGAAALGPDAPTVLTAEGTIAGTLYYMAPEQLQGKEVDARADIFAFGCVLYEMLTGKRAFDGANAASVIAAVMERPAPSVGEVAPAALDRVLKRCLAKDADERWQTARDLKWELMRAVETAPEAPKAVASRLAWVVAAVCAVAALGIGAVHFRQSAPEESPVRLALLPPEGGRMVPMTPNTAGGFAISPDGRTAAFTATVNGSTGIWVRPLDGGTARLLSGTANGGSPFWSPDGKSIGFFTNSRLHRIDIAGGSPVTVCPASVGRGGTWSEDGSIIFGTLGSGIFRVPDSGGTPRLLAAPDVSRGELNYRWPQILPGGQLLFHVVGSTEVTGAYVAPLADLSRRVRIIRTAGNAIYAPGSGESGYLLWGRGESLVAQAFNPSTLKLTGDPVTLADRVGISESSRLNADVSSTGLLLYSSVSPLSRLTWFDRTGKRMNEIGEPAPWLMLRLSPDGQRVAAASARSGPVQLWMIEGVRGLAGLWEQGAQTSLHPVWSPDGRSLVFRRDLNLFSKEAEGARAETRLTQSPELQDPTDWSRDGKWLLYFGLAAETQSDIWVMPVTPEGKPAPGEKARPWLRTQYSENYGRFSPEPNPRWIVYQSDESGRNEVYIDTFPEPRHKVRISTGGGTHGQWMPGGKEILYYSADGKIMSVSLKIGPDAAEPSTPRELFMVPVSDNGYSPFEIAPDGQRLLVRTDADAGPQPLTVLTNWPALMKKAGSK